MNRPISEICDFLCVSPDKLYTAGDEVVTSMVKAWDDDDFMEIHHLGYSLEMKNEGNNN